MPDAGALLSSELGRIERLIAVRSFASWAMLPQRELDVLAAIATPHVAPVGAHLMDEGAPARELYLVVEGELAISRRGRPVGRVGPRGAAAAMHAFARDPLGCSCVAAKRSTVLRIDTEDLEDVFDDHASTLIATVQGLARDAIALRLGDGDHAGGAAEAEDRPAPPRPLHAVERIRALASCAELGSPTIDGLALLASLAREERCAPGEILWRAGDASGRALAIVAGTLSCTTPEGQHFVLGAGGLAGALELLSGDPRFSDARVERPLVALAIERDALFDVWEDHVELGIETLRALARSLVELDDRRTA